jgi:hypothetical protein
VSSAKIREFPDFGNRARDIPIDPDFGAYSKGAFFGPGRKGGDLEPMNERNVGFKGSEISKCDPITDREDQGI